MYSRKIDSEPSLGRWEVRVLLALAKGRMTGYEIGTQCAEDVMGEVRLSNGSLYPAIKRLERLDYIESGIPAQPRPGRGVRRYALTRRGRQMLELEAAGWRRMVRLAESRL
jgi:PadR family transcriptional regulator PadR